MEHKKCPKCNSDVKEANRFCGKCGHDFEESTKIANAVLKHQFISPCP